MNERNLQPLSAALPPASTFADRLNAERQHWFVGRRDELTLFESLIEDQDCALLFLRGLAGVGKTSLLFELQRLRTAASGPVAFLDGVDLAGATEDELRQCLQRTLATLSGRTRAARPRPVLLVDSYERLGHALAWLHQHVIPSLPSDALLVLASRSAPPSRLTLDPAWTRLMQYKELLPFDESVSRRLLDLLGVPHAARRALLATAEGYPLALVIAAQALLRSGGDTLTVEHLRHLQSSLLQVLCPPAASNGQQLALDVCALARTTTVELLQRVLSQNPHIQGESAPELFEWLARRPFIEQGSAGVHPQPLARLALSGRVRRGNPKMYQATYLPVREHCVEQLSEGARHEAALGDLLYLDRDLTLVSRLGVRDGEHDEPTFHTPTEIDHDEIAALIRNAEGPEAAELALDALRDAPQTFEVTRDGLIDGLFQVTTLSSAEDVRSAERDPAARLAKQFVLDHPLPEGSKVLFFRRFLSRDEYQAPSGRVLTITARQTHLALGTQRLAYILGVFRRPEDWAPLWDAAGAVRQLVGTFEVGQFSYSLLAFGYEARSLRELLVDAWQMRTSTASVPPADSVEEQRLKVQERVAELGRSARLTARELDILRLLCLGGTFEEIAEQLHIRPRTVKFHQENLLRKTGSSSRIELFRKLI